jgi:nucleoside-diphosphate-sugar epimerase
VDIKRPEFSDSQADEFVLGDLRDPRVGAEVVMGMEEVYQLAADMGGAGYVFSGYNDAEIMHNSVRINANMVDACRRACVRKVFFSSSACVYPKYNQVDTNEPNCSEDSVLPAEPDSEYGWEKLFSERLYLSYMRNFGIQVHIGRYHNIFGPEGAWCNGREKVPAALCRKVAEASNGGTIEIWGDGKQTRSFLYIQDCIEATRLLMDSDFSGPVNIGSEEMISINKLAESIVSISGKVLHIVHIPGPLGVRSRNSDNRLIHKELGWKPTRPLEEGLKETYRWVEEQVNLGDKQ